MQRNEYVAPDITTLKQLLSLANDNMAYCAFVLQTSYMRPRNPRFALLLVIFATALTCAAPARAGLGGDEAQVIADGAEMHGTVQSVPGLAYDVQEITAGTGTLVREYLTRGGLVFAVSWSGPVVPDLKQLLGSHYDSYAKGLSALHPGLRRSVRIASGDLVVESGGHMRAYSGRAYLPSVVPAGVSLAELR